jgi:hypothetical protein
MSLTAPHNWDTNLGLDTRVERLVASAFRKPSSPPTTASTASQSRPSRDERQDETLKRVVSVLSTDVTPSKAPCEQARMLVEAKTTILNSGDFLPATEVAKLAGFSSTNLSVQPNKWKRNGEIFAIQHGREDYLPLYGIDPGDHRPRKEMAEILKVFGDAKDRWGLAFWFAGLNSFLDDERPQDALATDPEPVIAAAKDEMDEFRRR